MDLGNELKKLFSWGSRSGSLGLCLLWYVLHFVVSIWFFLVRIVHALESYLISNGFVKRYRDLNVSKVQYLAVAIDSEAAKQTSKVLELLQWLAAIGVERVCLYDTKGLLKKSSEEISERLRARKLSEEVFPHDTLDHRRQLNLEFLSSSDGKEALAKAANFLFAKHCWKADQGRPSFTENHMSEALRAIGCGGLEPDLLLVYGPARCHMGFPAWRLPYTEIVHMGPLDSMKFGSLVKAIHRFTMVQQNYGK